MAELICEYKRCMKPITDGFFIKTVRQHVDAKPEPETGRVTASHIFLTCSWAHAIAVAEHFRKLDEEGIDDGG